MIFYNTKNKPLTAVADAADAVAAATKVLNINNK